MCCIPNQRHREAEREKCYFWRILWRFRGESDIPAESWLMSGSWPSIEIEESLRRETCICKDCKCEGTQHGVVFGAHGEVLEPEMWTGEGSLWKSYSVFGLCSVAGLSAVNTQVFRWRTNSASALGWPFQYSASQSVRTTRNSLPQEPDEKSKFSSPTPAFRIRNSSHGIWESVCCVTAPSLSWRTLKFRNHCSGTSMGDAVGKYRLKLNRLLQIAQPWKKKKKARGMSVGRAGCMREDLVKPYTWQEISKGHLEHQLSNFIGSQHFLGAFQNLYLLGPTPDSSNRIGIPFRDPLSLLLLCLLGILRWFFSLELSIWLRLVNSLHFGGVFVK